METGVFIIVLVATIIALYMAWNIGANDVANAMGTSVGSGALTLRKALVVAAVLEFAGALLVGTHVTNTVRKGIVDPSNKIYADDPYILMYGMLAALLSAAIWLTIATYFSLPVSTTHSIVGALLGFGLITAGPAGVDLSVVGKIMGSWLLSPLVGAVIAFVLFLFIKRNILNKRHPLKHARRIAPCHDRNGHRHSVPLHRMEGSSHDHRENTPVQGNLEDVANESAEDLEVELVEAKLKAAKAKAAAK